MASLAERLWGRLSTSHPGLLPEVVLQTRRATVTDVAFPVAVEASPFLRGVSSRGVVVGTSGSQGSNKAGVSRDWGLYSVWRMCRQVHKDQGGLLISSSQCCSVSQGLPPSHMVLDLTIVEGRDEPFDEEYVIPRGGIRVRQMV